MRPVMERRFPQLLEAISELSAHARRDMAVNTTHARHTRRDRVPEIVALAKEEHPYEVPQLSSR
jgi:hypothetical protein